MGERIRAFDWSKTPLGPMEAWPERLRMAVDLVLASPMPMNLLWGPDFVQIYNDGFQPFFGTKHPTSLGQSANECWAELQHENDLIYARVFAGESVTFENYAWIYARGGDEGTWRRPTLRPTAPRLATRAVLSLVFSPLRSRRRNR
jgi:hypothetical protein